MSILSIQSHVVYGYAGNTAAVFPLQRLGYEVWVVNTVEFSNHTGYKTWRGKVLESELINDLVQGIQERGVLAKCQAVLSGYLGDASVAQAVKSAVSKAKSESPSAIYCCDPVMGDVGRGFYVKENIPDIIKDTLIPLADIVTPNQFELEAIVGFQIDNINDMKKALSKIHDMGPKVVLVTSFKNDKDNEISMLVSDRNKIYRISTPFLPISVGMAGSGDVTTALFLAQYMQGKDIKKALEYSTASIFNIIEKSWQDYNQLIEKPILMELRLIKYQNEITNPAKMFKLIEV